MNRIFDIAYGLKPAKTREEKQDEYYAALGRFMSAYATTEALVHMCFRTVCGVPSDVARILSSDWRLADLAGPIRRLAAINKLSQERQIEIDTLLTHINAISQFRHRLIHRGADVGEGDFFISTNWVSMKSIEDYEQVRFTVQDLRDATQDLRCITIRMHWVNNPELIDDSTLDEDDRKDILAPWRCKPPKPETPNRPLRKKRQSHGRRKRT